ncbi:hypothetical protein QJS10_CPB11g00909 [Acorus calamus]|uniref:Reverse transcriptase domain-containing protein n=1 Tax=Acorus calamus TaxID=4465 RepID=A0AAV9DS57_ACOCL|nr:hypothetical protein QJS10_CPB11g00909 [Acorus calamus]
MDHLLVSSEVPRAFARGTRFLPSFLSYAWNLLSQRLDKALLSNQVGSFTKKAISVSHLLFADDLIIFSAATAESGKGLRKILDQFAALSGLEHNRGKSHVFCGGKDHQRR